MLRSGPKLLVWGLALWAAIGLGQAAHAAKVQVLVQDAAGRALENAVVYLDSREAKAATKPMSGVQMSQFQRQFQPRVLAVTVGTPISFPNRDSVRHHVYSFSPAKPFEIKLYGGSSPPPVVFDKPGVVVLGCNIHDNMAGWIVVLETPFQVRTDAKGSGLIPDVPAGSYQLRIWHPGLPAGASADEQTLVLSGDVQLTHTLREVRQP